MCNEVPLHVVREALLCAHAAGATTVLNPAPATGIDRSIFGLADIVTPNRTELAILLQTDARGVVRRADTASDAAVRARALLESGPGGAGVRKAVIVTLGAEGAVVLERAGSGLDGVGVSGPNAPDPAATCDEEAPGEASATSAGEGIETPARATATSAPATAPATSAPAPAPAATATSAPAATSAAATAPAPAATGRAGKAARGSAAAGDIRVWEVPADRVATVDSTGAGDAFCGALAAALAEGRSLAEAVQRAVAAGALATTHVGAREGMPTAAELEEFIAGRSVG